MIDNAKANESISKTEEKAQGLTGKLGKGIATAGKWGLAIGGAAIAVGGAISGIVLKTADAASEISDMSKRTGQTAEEFQKYAYAAKLSGMETETLEKAMVKQQKAFSDAKDGSKSMSDAYKRLGIDINEVGTSGEAFDLVVKKLADMEDETTRNAIANDIFGKSYAELTPLLMEGSEGIDKLKQEAVDLGGVMSNETVDAGEKFGDTLDSVKTAFGGVIMKLGMQFMPTLQKMLEWVLANMPEIQDKITKVLGIVGEAFGAISDIITVLAPVFGVLFDAVSLVVDAFSWVADKVEKAYNWLNKWNDKDVEDKTLTVEERRNVHGKDATLASGLAYVPYDGYMAELHKGERVLSRGEVAMAGNVTFNITGNTIANDYDVDRIGDRIMEKLARQQRRNK